MPLPPDSVRLASLASDPKRRHVIAARIVKVVALSCVIGLMAACSETTAPKASTAPPPVVKPVPAAMVSLAGSLDDMTQWFMQSFDDEATRTKFQDILSGLKGHLTSGNVTVCQQDVTAARGVLTSLSDVQQVETAPLGLALDAVQTTLDNVSQ